MRKRRRRWVEVLIAFLSVALLIAGVNYYIMSMQQSLWTESVSEVLEVTKQGAHAFEIYLEKDMEMMDRLAHILSRFPSTDEETILDRLDIYGVAGGNFSAVELAGGTFYSNTSPDRSVTLGAEDLEAYKGLSDRGFKEPYPDEYTGQSMIGYYERFTFSDGVEGIVQMGKPVSDVTDEFVLSFYDNAGFSYVVNGNGDILLRSHHKNSNRTFLNVFDVIELEGNSEEAVQTLRDGMTGQKRGVMRFMLGGEKYIFAFVPVQNTEGWYMIAIIPDAAIMESTNRILNTTQSIIFIIGISLLIFGVFMVMIQRYNKNVKEKEREVQYREQLFGILANNTNDVFLMLSGSNLDVEYVSPNVERVLGVPWEKAKGDLRVLGSASYVNGGEATYETLAQIETGGSVTYESERVHLKTGEHKWFVETTYRTTIDKTERFIVTISDRTAERRSEQALEEALEIAKAANESKSTFLSNMSHDIRTPMNAIVGLVTLIEHDAHDPEKVLDHTKKIAASSQHLLGLINDVLDMSKIESGKTTLNITEVDLDQVVEELQTIVRPQAKAKNQEFSIAVEGVTVRHFLGDKLRINQILINILSNAVKYTPEGGSVNMVVTQAPQTSEHYAHLQFVVHDTGIGMSEEFLDSIFQPFSREENSTTNRVQGTGLGMAITKNLVDLMGGTITVESSPDAGSTFTVDLELRISEVARYVEAKEPAAEDAARENVIAGKHFLAAEDNDINAEILTELLKMRGGTCDLVVNGLEAAERFEQSKPGEYDAILMDVQMPVMNGYEATGRIRACGHPDAGTVPIIAMTANAFADDVKDALDAGMDAHVAKPIDMSHMESVLANIFSKNGFSVDKSVGN